MSKNHIKVASILTAILFGQTAFAQSTQWKFSMPQRFNDHIVVSANKPTAQQSHFPNARTTAAKALYAIVDSGMDNSVVVAKAFSDFTYSNNRTSHLTDSAIVHHSPIDRADVKNIAAFRYDTCELSTPASTFIGQRFIQTFDNNNNVLTNTLQQRTMGSLPFTDFSQYVYTYDANNNLTSQTRKNTDNTQLKDISRITYTYDANNNLLTLTPENWDGTKWDNHNLIRHTYTYDVNNNITDILLETGDNNTWSNLAEYTDYVYDADDNLISLVDKRWDGTTWNNTYKEVHTYDVNNSQTSYVLQTWDGGTSTWVDPTNKTIHSYTYDNNLNIITDTIKGIDNSGTHEYQYESFTYNADNQVTHIAYYQWSNNQYDFRKSTTFYYEKRERPNLAVNNIATKGGQIQLYPVPARNEISLNISWDNQQAFTVSIYDMQGKCLKVFSEPAVATYSKKISVADLASGTYLMKIVGDRGQVATQSFNVVR